MFKSLGRLLRAVGHKIAGVFGRKTESLMKDSDAMRGAYADVIDEKTGRINQYMKAVGEMAAQNEGRLGNIKRLTDQISHLEKVKGGALAKAKQVQAELTAAGKSAEEIAQDGNMLKYRAAYADASSTLTSKQEQVAQIETEIAAAKTRIDGHKVQLQTMQREIKKLKSESSEAVADVKAAQFEKSIADTISGISEDSTDQTLEMLRGVRDNARGEATIAREVAGNNADALENELANFGASSEEANEFDALMNGDSFETKTIEDKSEVEMDLSSKDS